MGFLKGQSATEQLITYGWAGMILVVVVGVLLYLGVFSLSNAVPERCVFQSGFFCKTHRIYLETDSTINVKLDIINKFSRKVTITGALCSDEPTNPSTGYPERGLQPVSPQIVFLPEGTRTLNLTCYQKDGNPKGGRGESFGGLVYVKYSEDLGNVPNLAQVTGEHVKVANIGGRIN